MNTQEHDPNASKPLDSAWVSQAEDGDAMIIVEGVGLKEGVGIEVDLGVAGRMRAAQEGRVVLDTELDELGHDMVAQALKVLFLEVYKGKTTEDDRFVVHQAVGVNGIKGAKDGDASKNGQGNA